MPNPERNPDHDVVVHSDGRLAGCRGRALVAVLLVGLVLVLLGIALVWGMAEESQPIPAPARTAPEAPGGS